MENKAAKESGAFRKKAAAMREAMRREGLSGLLFYSSGQLSMLEVNAVLWISGVLPMGPHTGVFLGASGEASILVSLPWDVGRVKEKTWIEDVRVVDRFADGAAEFLRRGGIKGELGIVGWSFMPAAVYQGLEAIPDIRLRPADKLLNTLARFPGEEARGAIRRAAEMADIGFAAILEKARVGMREHELAAEVEYAMRSQGSEDNFGMVTASDHSHCTHPPADRRIQPGDVIIAEITPACEGHFIQLCRTAVVGPASPLLSEKFAILEEAMEKSLDRVRPGNKIGEVAQVMNHVFSAYGYEKYCRPPYMRVRGHGLGFLSMPFPEIVDENEAVIEEGMCFVVHPNQYLPETGYLMLGDTVWVEANGARRLTTTPMELFTVEG
ncbi:MAG: aminopeptidase P family protein [Deltaproteobacteria bacterium]|nr:aminopeptidase P family protein [Deltaproteobacteria bacterium]